MGRNRDESDDEEEDYDTDSDCEYKMDVDMCNIACSTKTVSTKRVQELFVLQRGLCRVSGLPFASGMYQPVVASRKINQPIGNENCILVLDVVERMRSASGQSWRTFARLLQLIAKDAEI